MGLHKGACNLVYITHRAGLYKGACNFHCITHWVRLSIGDANLPQGVEKTLTINQRRRRSLGGLHIVLLYGLLLEGSLSSIVSGVCQVGAKVGRASTNLNASCCKMQTTPNGFYSSLHALRLVIASFSKSAVVNFPSLPC